MAARTFQGLSDGLHLRDQVSYCEPQAESDHTDEATQKMVPNVLPQAVHTKLPLKLQYTVGETAVILGRRSVRERV